MDDGGSATCKEGAGLRATAKCLITHTGKNVTKKGPWVGAKGISKVQCPGGQVFISNGFEIS